MLVLGREKGQSIIIGDNIEICVVDINNSGQVRLGITAPKSIEVHRREVFNAIQREKSNEKK